MDKQQPIQGNSSTSSASVLPFDPKNLLVEKIKEQDLIIKEQDAKYLALEMDLKVSLAAQQNNEIQQEQILNDAMEMQQKLHEYVL